MTSPRRRPSARRSTRALVGAALAGVLVLAPVTASAAAADAAPPAPSPTDAASAAAAVGAMNYVVNSVPGEVTTAAAVAAVVAAGGTVLAAWDEIGVVTARSTDPDFADRLRTSSAVESAGPTRTAAVRAASDVATTDVATTGTATPADPSSGVQSTGLVGQVDAQATQVADVADPAEQRRWDDQAVHAAEARAVQPGSPDVLVGVLDSGVDATHPDLASQVDPTASAGCSVDGVADTAPAAWAPSPGAATSIREHGTHVAGIIAAADDGRGIVGVAPGVRLASVKVVDADGFIYPEYAICGYMWAAEQGMDVTNASFFVDPWAAWCAGDADQAAALEAVGRAVAWSQHEGVLDVAAVGNAATGAVAADLAHKTTDSRSPNDSTPVAGRDVSQGCVQLPAESEGVIAVSSAQQGLGGAIEKSRFSNYGDGVVDLTAPGSSVVSTIPGGGFAALSGTSMAAPHVAGVAALLATVHRGATPAELTALLTRQAGGQLPTEYFGAGLVDAFAAVTEDLGRGPTVVAPDGALQAGAPATLRGAGFTPGETVEVASAALAEAAPAVADVRGRVELPVRLSPQTPVGALSLDVVGSSGATAVVAVEVQEALAGPVVTSPLAGTRLTSGQPLVVTGTALDSALVTVTVEPAAGAAPSAPASSAVASGTTTLTVRADEDGSFGASVAALDAGGWQVSAVMRTVDDVVSARGQAVPFAVDAAPTPVPGAGEGEDGGGGDGGLPAGPGTSPSDPVVAPAVGVTPVVGDEGARGRELPAGPARASSDSLAWTGSEPRPPALAALLVVALGVVGLVAGRRRPRVDVGREVTERQVTERQVAER